MMGGVRWLCRLLGIGRGSYDPAAARELALDVARRQAEAERRLRLVEAQARVIIGRR